MAKEIAIKIIEKSQVQTKTSTRSTGTAGGSLGKGLLLKLGAVVGSIAMLKNVLDPIFKLLQAMFTIVFMPLVMVLLALLRPFLMLGIRWLRKQDSNLVKGIQMVGEGAQTLATGSGSDIISDYMSGIEEVSKGTDVMSSVVTSLGIKLTPLVAIFSVLKSIFTGEFFTKEYWSKVWGGLSEVWKWITDQLSVVWTTLKNVWDIFTSGLSDIWDILKGVWDTISNGLSTAWGKVKEVWELIIAPQLQTAWDGVKGVWETIKTSLSTVWDGVKGVWETIKTSLSTVWDTLKSVWDTITDGLNTIWTSLSNVFNGIVGALRDAWDKLTSVFHRKDKEEGTRQHGGEVLSTGRYLLHKGERVIPETQTSNLGGTININITGSVNDNNLAEIIRQVSKEMRRAGAW